MLPPVRLKKPFLHAQVFVAGPVKEQMELAPQPPLLVLQLLIAVQPRPSELAEAYPELHAHEWVAGPVKVQVENEPQPPLLVRQLLMAVQPRPLEVGEE